MKLRSLKLSKGLNCFDFSNNKKFRTTKKASASNKSTIEKSKPKKRKIISGKERNKSKIEKQKSDSEDQSDKNDESENQTGESEESNDSEETD